jgi:ferrochelatase
VSKLRAYFNHPDFVQAWIARAMEAVETLPAERRQRCYVLFTAHSIPVAMADTSAYLPQLQELARLVAAGLELPPEQWQLVFQSRSGPPQQPWLEPDVCDVISDLGTRHDVKDVVLVPIGFVSDHIEILYDLDIEAVQAAEEAGVTLTRAAAVGTHPRLVAAIRQLVVERLEPGSPRRLVGEMEMAPDTCPPDCCVMKRP